MSHYALILSTVQFLALLWMNPHGCMHWHERCLITLERKWLVSKGPEVHTCLVGKHKGGKSQKVRWEMMVDHFLVLGPWDNPIGHTYFVFDVVCFPLFCCLRKLSTFSQFESMMVPSICPIRGPLPPFVPIPNSRSIHIMTNNVGPGLEFLSPLVHGFIGLSSK